MPRLATALILGVAAPALASAQLIRDYSAESASSGLEYVAGGAAYIPSRDTIVINELSRDSGTSGSGQPSMRAYSIADGGLVWSNDAVSNWQEWQNGVAPDVSDAGVLAFFASNGERVLLSPDGDLVDRSYITPEGEMVEGTQVRWLREGVLAFRTSKISVEGGRGGGDRFFPWRMFPGGERLSDPTGEFTGIDFGSVANGDGPNLRDFAILVAAPTADAPDRVITAGATSDRDFGNRRGTTVVAMDMTTGVTLAVLKPNCAERICGVTTSVVVDPSGGDVYVVERRYEDNSFVVHRITGDLSSYVWSRQVTTQFVDWTFDFFGQQPFNVGFQNAQSAFVNGELVVAAELRFEDWGPVSPVAVPEVDIFNGGVGSRVKMLTETVETSPSGSSAQDIALMTISMSDGSFSKPPRVVGTEGRDSLIEGEVADGSVLDIGDGDLALIGSFNRKTFLSGGGALGLVVLSDGECN